MTVFWPIPIASIVAAGAGLAGERAFAITTAGPGDAETVATLGDAGVETSLWIGQACLSGDGRYAVVVYAPREVTNMAGAMGDLGRAAVVNLSTGTVRQLGLGYSVAYFDPGCGTGGQAVLTRGGWGGDTSAVPASTQLQLINIAAATTALSVTVPGLFVPNTATVRTRLLVGSICTGQGFRRCAPDRT